MKASLSKKYAAVGALALAVVTLAIGVTAPLVVGRRVEDAAKQRAELALASADGRIRDGLAGKMDSYERTLVGIGGLFGALNAVKRDEFVSFVDRLDIADHFPALDAVVFVRRIAPTDRAEFVDAVRGDDTVSKGGYPDFTIFPLGERDQYAVGDYVYPVAKENGLLGYDFLSDPAWAEAIASASKTGAATMTAALRLPAGDGSRGFLLVQPVRRKDSGPGAVPFGFVIGLVRSDALFREVSANPSEAGDALNFVITDTSSGTRLYFTPGSENAARTGRVQAQEEWQVAGRRIGAVFYAPPSLGISKTDAELAAIILYGGLVASVLLALLLTALATITWRADHLANRMIAELREQQMRDKTRSMLLQTMLESMPVGVFVVRAPTGSVEYLNKAGLRLIDGQFVPGATIEEHMKFIEVLTPKGDPYPMQDIPTIITLGTGEFAVKDDIVIKRKDESLSQVRVTSVPVKDQQGAVTYVVTVFEDVTSAKEHERQNMEFISIASHQMRTGLASVRWMTDLFDDAKGQLSRKQKNIIRDITSANERMTRLVNDLLNVNRLDLGKIKMKIGPTDLVSVFSDVAKELAPRLKQRHLKIVVKTDKTAMVLTDPSMIRETVLNLLSNAVKYTRENTSITVTTSRKDGMIEFSVADQGIGIPEKEVGKLFRPFFRASNVESGNIEGTGMGLYITRKIVELSGGKIWAETKEGEGSTFRFTLPIADDGRPQKV